MILPLGGSSPGSNPGIPILNNKVYKLVKICKYLNLLKMVKTKKVGSTGRFGSRYGLGVKQRLLAIENKQKATYECPSCHKVKLKRLSSGIWLCNGCEIKVAGRAYAPWE